MQMDSTTGPPPSKERVNGAYRFGCVTLLGALFLFVVLCIWGAVESPQGPPAWTPVRMSIPLIAGHAASAQFTSDQNGVSLIGVEIKSRLPLEQLGQIRPPELAIQVSSEGRLVSLNRYEQAHHTGEFASFNWATWGGDLAGQALGDFRAVSGRRYTIQVRVRRADPKLRGLDPHLVVNLGPPRGSYDDEDLVGAVGVDLFLLLLLIGIPSLVVGIRRMK
jgi:hypothetical protein